MNDICTVCSNVMAEWLLYLDLALALAYPNLPIATREIGP